MSFEELKKTAATLSNLTEQAKEDSGAKKNYSDDRFWNYTPDDAGNGYAEIRFLPIPDGETKPWVKYYSFGFKGPTGGWYIENCLTSVGKNDPVSEYNSKMWNDTTGTPDDIKNRQDLVRKRKRRVNYVYNILVIDDPKNPDNNGKVKLFRSGKKIFDKLITAMEPEFPDTKAFVPFDFWEGANFKLRVKTVAGFVNYDSSGFETPSKLYDGDEDKLKEVYKNLYSLEDFLSDDKFKSYDELKVRAYKVLGLDMEGNDSSMSYMGTGIDGLHDSPTVPILDEDVSNDKEETDSLEFFKKLAKESEQEAA